jgi:hypothetical protein
MSLTRHPAHLEACRGANVDRNEAAALDRAPSPRRFFIRRRRQVGKQVTPAPGPLPCSALGRPIRPRRCRSQAQQADSRAVDFAKTRAEIRTVEGATPESVAEVPNGCRIPSPAVGACSTPQPSPDAQAIDDGASSRLLRYR